MATGGRAQHPRVPAAVPPAAPPAPVRLPVNLHRWDRITFLHWRVDPAALEPFLPPDLTALTYDGSAWVGITPFVIRVRVPPGVPPVPGSSTFPETNVRTYVAGPDGGQALWFLHMEVTQPWFVLALRSVGLPYVRRDMAVRSADGRVAYVSETSPPGGGHAIAVRPGAALRPPGGGPLERFLTAWWSAYHEPPGRPALLRTPVAHPRWPLHRATVEVCDTGALFDAVGLPRPDGDPVAHYSPGVPVRVGRPRVVRLGRPRAV